MRLLYDLEADLVFASAPWKESMQEKAEEMKEKLHQELKEHGVNVSIH